MCEVEVKNLQAGLQSNKIQKMKIHQLLYLAIFLLISCESPVTINEDTLTIKPWFDRYGNVYKFVENDFYKKTIIYDIWKKIGTYKIIKDSLQITDFDNSDAYRIKVISLNEKQLIVEKSVIDSVNLREEVFTHQEAVQLWRNQNAVIDKEEELISLKITEKSIGLGEGGVKEIRIDATGKINYLVSNQDKTITDTTYTFDDTIFGNLEMLIRTIPLEDYKESYIAFLSDGGSSQIEVETNKVSKKIYCRNTFPEGLGSLRNYVLNVNHDMLNK